MSDSRIPSDDPHQPSPHDPSDTFNPHGAEPIEASLPKPEPATTGAGPDQIFEAELVDDRDQEPQSRTYRPRRKKLPLILFALTCVSTFWVGATKWRPEYYLFEQIIGSGNFMPARQTIYASWSIGLTYMTCVLAILLTHEMGHFVATLLHRIRASLPYFLPIPFNPIGTLGAVIGMDGRSADRRQMFDIGIAGPIAGLVIAVPIMWIGVQQLDLQANPPGGPYAFDSPLLVQWMLDYQQPPGYQPGTKIWVSQLNPFYMAGWIGLLITGLNMIPVSQLDGGHIVYTLFGKHVAHWVARGFVVIAIAFMIYAKVYIWVPMIVIVLLMGTDHPPTRDDNVPIGWFRTLLGYASLLIPILCFPPNGLTVAEF